MAELASAPRPGEPRPGPEGLGRVPADGTAPRSGILIVEDEAELVRALRINLLARQYEVLTAADRPGGAGGGREPARPTRSSWTSACPTSTAPR